MLPWQWEYTKKVERGEWSARAVLAGLYARGAFAQGAAPPIGLSSLQSLEKLPRRKWPQVRDLLLQSDVPLSDVPGLLRRNGLWEEASLCSTGFLAYGLSLVETGQVVTAACVSYPAAWLTRLGSGSPPAFWASGPLPPGLGSLRLSSAGAALSEPVAGPGSALSGSALSGSAGRDPGGRSSSQGGSAGSVIGVVGSRQLSQMGERVAWTLGGAIAKAGCILVSGGAVGADRWSALGACAAIEQGKSAETERFGPCPGAEASPVSVVEIWPYGLAWGTRHRPQPAQGVVALSLCCPTSGFSTSQAMERNSLIYALSQVTFVIEPRFRQGGTWHGAVEALRKLRSVLLVAGEGQGATGLSHLGATVFDPLTFEEFSQGLRLPSIIPWALAQGSGGKPSQPSLFGNSLVRETRPLWPDAVPLPTHSAQSRLDSATL